MEKQYVFPEEQRSIGGILICSCCNEVLANGAECEKRGGHKVHGHCAKKFDAVMKMKPEIKEIFAGAPEELFKEQYLGSRLERAYTISAIRILITDFCRVVGKAIEKAKSLGGEAKEELMLFVEKVSEPLVRLGGKVQLQPHQIAAYLAI